MDNLWKQQTILYNYVSDESLGPQVEKVPHKNTRGQNA